MKEAIEFLRRQEINVTDSGEILSALPSDESGLLLVEELQDLTQSEAFCYTIVGNQITQIEL